MIGVALANVSSERILFFRRIFSPAVRVIGSIALEVENNNSLDCADLIIFDDYQKCEFLNSALERCIDSVRIPVIVVGATEICSECRKHCLQLGAADFLEKADCLPRLESSVLLAVQGYKNDHSITEKKSDLGNWGLSAPKESMRTVRSRILRYAGRTEPVVILGESGSGKDVVAHNLHEYSPRRDSAFVPINCGALAPSLCESELFGVVRGAYTGSCAREGAFRHAHGGTLFLDEISELSLESQASLLRVIETGKVRPVGSDCRVDVDVRLLAASNRNLAAMAQQGMFRKDLLYRLMVFCIIVPPLRNRQDELPDIIAELLKEVEPDRPLQLSASAQQKLLAWSWPGNVRELRNTLQRAVVDSTGSYIQAEDIRFLSLAQGCGNSLRLSKKTGVFR